MIYANIEINDDGITLEQWALIKQYLESQIKDAIVNSLDAGAGINFDDANKRITSLFVGKV
jgi:hypothetical protein